MASTNENPAIADASANTTSADAPEKMASTDAPANTTSADAPGSSDGSQQVNIPLKVYSQRSLIAVDGPYGGYIYHRGRADGKGRIPRNLDQIPTKGVAPYFNKLAHVSQCIVGRRRP